MEFSQNAYANELSGNGLMTFFAAYQRNELDYERFYATMPSAQATRILRELFKFHINRVIMSTSYLAKDAPCREHFAGMNR